MTTHYSRPAQPALSTPQSPSGPQPPSEHPVAPTAPTPAPASSLRWRFAILALPAATGLILALVMPRGPMTSGQSLAAMAAAVVVGAATGWVLRTRWAALLAPVLLAAVFEAARLGVQGPTVDAVRWGGIYEMAALVVGRGFTYLVIALPMVVAAFWGAAWARRVELPPAELRADPRPTRRHRARLLAARGTLVLASLLVVALAVGLGRPASTEAITAADGGPLEGSIAELVTVSIGGHNQGIMLRGNDAGAPVLLFLEGGPGGTATGSMRYAGEGLEEHFVVATWDQRGTGRSAAAFEPAATLTIDQLVSDTIEVTEYLLDHFDETGVYLVGNSWGTTLGVLAVQQRPDLFHAYVGAGQMVDQQETDKLMYAESLDYAQRSGDSAFEEKLREAGTPPYTDMLAYADALTANPEWHDYQPGPDHDWRSSYPANLFVAEYTLTEQVRSAAGLMDTFAQVYPQLQDTNFRVDVPALDVPVYVVEGTYEAPGRAVLAREWFELLQAPSKSLVEFDRSGHVPHLDEPGRFATYMAEVVLPETR